MRVTIIILMFGFAYCGHIPENRPDEGADWSDIGLGQIGLIVKYQYPAEQHYVTTDDGYILSLIRIPYGRICPQEQSKGVVILQHGILVSSFIFTLSGTKRGLAYILADSCYDVWMPNSRGNSLSRGHIKYSIDDYEYWDFSWHELGVYDHPAVMDYVLNITGVENVTYIGHSQGTTSFMVFNIMRPEYAEKVKAAFLLAPIAYLSHTKSIVLQLLSKIGDGLKVMLDSLKIYSLLEKDGILNNLANTFCTNFSPINPFICENILFVAYGFDYVGTNMTLTTMELRHEFYGTSTKQLVHFAQLVNSGKFRQYDYGLKNLQKYKQLSPPDYDLSKVTVPTHLYYSENDKLSNIKDVLKLMRELPNIQEEYLVPFEKFNHMDHVWANDIIGLEYDHLIEQIDKIHGY